MAVSLDQGNTFYFSPLLHTFESKIIIVICKLLDLEYVVLRHRHEALSFVVFNEKRRSFRGVLSFRLGRVVYKYTCSS